MSSKEAYLAIELDRARGSNLEDTNLAAVIADYFTLDDSEASSDDGEAGKSLFVFVCFVDILLLSVSVTVSVC